MDSLTISSEYRPLHKYLRDRFANVVVLSFTQIEDLMGSPLPAAARQQSVWWTGTGEAGAVASPQSGAWSQAARTAIPNMAAHNVTFERSYKDGEEWKTTTSFGRDDLLTLAKVADLAHSWIINPTEKTDLAKGRLPKAA